MGRCTRYPEALHSESDGYFGDINQPLVARLQPLVARLQWPTIGEVTTLRHTQGTEFFDLAAVHWDAVGFPVLGAFPFEFAGDSNLVDTFRW
jgi:hypothetical protein